MVSIGYTIREFTVNSKDLGGDLLAALIIVIIGIFIGKFVKLILGRISRRLKLDKILKYGTVNVGLTVIKWSIYLFFIGFAIEMLNIPYLSEDFIDTLSIIPISVGALVILIAGYFLGGFFKNATIQADKEWTLLGNIIFFFFMYLAFMISIQLIFAFNHFLVNWISIIFTGFFLLFLTLRYKK